MEQEQAVRATRTIATRMKLTAQARAKMQWSDAFNVVPAAMWFFFAYQALRDVGSYKAYDMARLTPTHLLSPAMHFTLGVMFLNQIFLSSVLRRLNAVTQLLNGGEG